ncbi:MbtH family protein [Streptosporangium sandarakinum]|uniref:MbtH protein n=1 Tax=Streptosporangium sandarakinum TaxID=1260955 RepID=A0A852UNQ1_9ACTN|nr:MbtH protein [Streptosporangium sandarakinum]
MSESVMDTKVADTKVVVNDEEQYSVWPVGRSNPDGWHDEGFAGSREECLAHIERVWTDMRPRSLREAMAAGAGADTDAGTGTDVSADTGTNVGTGTDVGAEAGR